MNEQKMLLPKILVLKLGLISIMMERKGNNTEEG
jgi:hypothetical protein